MHRFVTIYQNALFVISNARAICRSGEELGGYVEWDAPLLHNAGAPLVDGGLFMPGELSTRARYCPFSTRRRILPDVDLGTASMNSTKRMRL